MTLRLPFPLTLAPAVFRAPFDANLVVVRGVGGPSEWDGLLTLSWVETVGGAWNTLSAPCATRPGKHYLSHPMHPAGTAIIQPGRHALSHARGQHHAGTTRASQAWVQVGKVTVKRDGNTNEVLDALGGPVMDASGVNIHRIDDLDYLAGCIGVQPGPLDFLLAAFDRLALRLPQPRVSLTLVEG